MLVCFRCDEAASNDCPRCGQLFCYDHGDALCGQCEDPSQAAPAYRVYRGSLMALALGAVFALWLLLSPPPEATVEPATLLIPAVTATAQSSSLR